MSGFKKKETNKFWHSPLMLIVLFCLLVLFAYNMIGLIQKERETSRNKVGELNKIEDLRMRETSLSVDIERLNTPQGIEESIRDKFQVVKPGEKEVLILQEQEKVELDEKSKDHTFWGYIKKMFGK